MPVRNLSTLRVGVVVPALVPAAWVTEAVVGLAATGARIAVCVVANSQPAQVTGWSRLLVAVGGALATADPDVPRPLSELAGVDIVDAFDAVDVVFFVGVSPGAEPTPARHRLGVWELAGVAHLAGMRETIDDQGAVELALRRVDQDGLLRPTGSRVQRLSPATTRARALWQAAALPARALSDLAAARVPLLKGLDPKVATTITATSAIAGAAKLTSRAMATGVRRLLARNQWFVATCIDAANPVPDLEQSIVLQAPADRFWADPFPVVDGDRACIFVEEWPYALGRGVLAAIEIDRAGNWRRLGTILEQPYHLSHPFVFAWQGETWLLPESSAAGTLELYRCLEYPLRWERETVLMQDKRIVDATLHEGTDRWWMFANIGDDRVSTHEELHLFFADTPLGPWTPHPANPVVADPRFARPAGRPFELDGCCYRPAQDCGVRYGGALVIHEILELTPERYAERLHQRLPPQALAGANRMHTLNQDQWLTVIDGHRDRWRLT